MRADQQNDRVEALEIQIAKAREAKKTGPAYQSLIREVEVQQGFYDALVNRMRQEQTHRGSTQTAYDRILQRAIPEH
jgi:uncharacterized protein involved in exopolysaccharide biosynthesis